MKNTKTITILCLLASAFLAPFAAAESPTVLLKQGIYVEETEGDLDKAIEIYKQVLDQAAKVQRLASRATFQLGMCHLKKGEKEKAAEYFQQLISKYPTQKTLAKKAAAQLKEIKPETKESVFEQIDYQVTRFMGEKFGETAAEAGQQNLLINSHVYFVDSDGFSYSGGLNAYYNWTGRTTGKKVHFGGTSYPNQTLYGVDGHELNTEIVPDKTRPNHWQIYWIPDEPLAPEESLYYGWSRNDKQKLAQLPGDVYSLVMQNKYGSAVIETFFLVLPKDLEISKSNPPTDSKELLDFNIYWWTKQVPQNKNHIEHVSIKKDYSAEYTNRLKNKITVSAAKSPDGDRLTIQYATIEICKAAEVPYQWNKSQQLAGEKARRYIEPINFENISADDALRSILEPVGLKYAINKEGVYLTDIKDWAKNLVEDFFQHNYRDITSRRTVEWGQPTTDAKGNVSISYKYEQVIWDKDKYLANQIFTFDKHGNYLNARKVEGFPKSLGTVPVPAEDISSKEAVKKLVNKFFSRNYRDITSRKTIEWSELRKDSNGNVSIRYKFEAVIRGKDKIVTNRVFTFDKNGQFVSAKDVEDFPIKSNGNSKNENSSFLTPEKTIQTFMAAAVKLDKNKAMVCVAPDSHDYKDIKRIFEMSEHPFNIMFRKLDTSKPTKIIEASIIDNMCTAVWQVAFKEEFTIEGHTFKPGDTFDIDGNLRKYGDKWLITGI